MSSLNTACVIACLMSASSIPCRRALALILTSRTRLLYYENMYRGENGHTDVMIEREHVRPAFRPH